MSAGIEPFVNILTAGQTPRVWSLLVTVFGDLVQEKEARIHGASLSHLTDLMGVKPEANRVALHRLRKEGWITSERLGRRSAYMLTDRGRLQSASASPVIYTLSPTDNIAKLIITPPQDTTPQNDATLITVAPGVVFAPAHASGGPMGFELPLTPETSPPDWMRQRTVPADVVALSDEVAKRFEACVTLLGQHRPLTRIEVAVLRVLIVHNWRRIVLRSPALPDFLFADAWRGAQCRALASDLLGMLPRPALADLEADIRATLPSA